MAERQRTVLRQRVEVADALLVEQVVALGAHDVPVEADVLQEKPTLRVQGRRRRVYVIVQSVVGRHRIHPPGALIRGP
jgi:hypothetical protein